MNSFRRISNNFYDCSNLKISSTEMNNMKGTTKRSNIRYFKEGKKLLEREIIVLNVRYFLPCQSQSEVFAFETKRARSLLAT